MLPWRTASDSRLVAEASAGEREAFGELVLRHGSAVRVALRRMGATPALADDLAQDAFLIAHEQLPSLRLPQAFGGWVTRIAARLYVKRWRREAHRPDFAADVGEESSPADGAPAVDARLDLERGLTVLSAAERLCVVLCYGLELSHTEAAELLELPLGTVKSHVKRGHDKLKTQLSKEGRP